MVLFSIDLIDIDATVVVGKGTALLLAMEGFSLQINKNGIHYKNFLSQCPPIMS